MLNDMYKCYMCAFTTESKYICDTCWALKLKKSNIGLYYVNCDDCGKEYLTYYLLKRLVRKAYLCSPCYAVRYMPGLIV